MKHGGGSISLFNSRGGAKVVKLKTKMVEAKQGKPKRKPV